MSISPFDVCRHCGLIQNLHYPGTKACEYFCALPQPNVPTGNHPMIDDLHRCPECSVSCLSDADLGVHFAHSHRNLPQPNVPTGNHPTPILMQLRLEQKVAESAAKWWKVEDWVKENALEKYSGQVPYALRDFIVSLMKG